MCVRLVVHKDGYVFGEGCARDRKSTCGRLVSAVRAWPMACMGAGCGLPYRAVRLVWKSLVCAFGLRARNVCEGLMPAD